MLNGSHSDLWETTGVRNCGESGRFKEEFGVETECVWRREGGQGPPWWKRRRGEVWRGKLNDDFCLVWAGGSIDDVSLETIGAVSGRCAALLSNSQGKAGSGFEGGNLQSPSVQSMEAPEVGKEKPGGLSSVKWWSKDEGQWRREEWRVKTSASGECLKGRSV